MGVFDVETVKPFVYGGNVMGIVLLIYNGPNHGTYGTRAQGPYCPPYRGTTGFSEHAFHHMGKIAPQATVMMHYSGWYTPGLRVEGQNRDRPESDLRQLLMGPASATYRPLNSSRTLLREVDNGGREVMAACLVVVDHLQLVKYDSHGRLDTTSLVLGILDQEAARGRVAISFGAYVANFEAYLLEEWIRCPLQ